jgi:predicted amidophosphoribosyltransferase
MPSCNTCGKQIEATARICPSCGALTGVHMRSTDASRIRVLGFSSAAVVAFFAFVLLRWLGFLP